MADIPGAAMGILPVGTWTVRISLFKTWIKHGNTKLGYFSWGFILVLRMTETGPEAATLPIPIFFPGFPTAVSSQALPCTWVDAADASPQDIADFNNAFPGVNP